MKLSPIPYSMSDTIKIRNNEYFGFYRGTVLENNDPKGRGRCKVYVHGVYDKSFKEDNGKRLPWAEPSQPLFCGGNGKNGTFQCPDLNATVWCFFESGDISRPIMFGQTTDKESAKVSLHHTSSEPLFTPSSCIMYWDGMYVEMYKPTHTITVSSENISATASNNLSGHADNNIYFDAGNNIYVEAKNDIYVKAGNNMEFTVMNEFKNTVTSKSTHTCPDNHIIGPLHITGAIKDDSTVTCTDCIANVTLNNHIHMGDGGPAPAPTSSPIA